MHRRSKRILTVLSILIVILAVTYAILLARATGKLRRAYAALAAEGRPMRAAEIMPAKIHDSENAAVLYRRAILLLKSQPVGDKSVFDWLNPPRLLGQGNARQREQERREVMGQEVVAKALALIEEGTRRPACQFDKNLGDSPGLVLANQQMTEVEELRPVISARVGWEMQAGHWDKAWDLLLLELKFVDSLRWDLLFTSQESRLMSIWAMCRITIRNLCESAPLDASRYQALEGLLKGLDDTDPLVRAVDAERLLIAEPFFNLPPNELYRVLGGKSPLPGLFKAIGRLTFTVTTLKPRLVADHAAYLNLARKRVQLWQGPYRDRKEIEAFLHSSSWNVLTHRVARGGNIDISDYWRMVTDLHLTRAGLALLQYQQAHGAFPETLEALGVEGLTDPYTGKALLYRPEGVGFVVYSVGQDRQDNGGVPKPDERDRQRRHDPYDEVWRFPKPKYPAATEAR
jgi:hypothetical protein